MRNKKPHLFEKLTPSFIFFLFHVLCFILLQWIEIWDVNLFLTKEIYVAFKFYLSGNIKLLSIFEKVSMQFYFNFIIQNFRFYAIFYPLNIALLSKISICNQEFLPLRFLHWLNFHIIDCNLWNWINKKELSFISNIY